MTPLETWPAVWFDDQMPSWHLTTEHWSVQSVKRQKFWLCCKGITRRCPGGQTWLTEWSIRLILWDHNTLQLVKCRRTFIRRYLARWHGNNYRIQQFLGFFYCFGSQKGWDRKVLCWPLMWSQFLMHTPCPNWLRVRHFRQGQVPEQPRFNKGMLADPLGCWCTEKTSGSHYWFVTFWLQNVAIWVN